MQVENLREIRRPSAWVYLIGLRDSQTTLPYTKVGVTGDIERRIRGMSTGLPFDIFVHALAGFSTRDEAMAAEASAHQKLSNLHVRGEWFAGQPCVHVPKIRELIAHIEKAGAKPRTLEPSAKPEKPKKLFKYEVKLIQNGIRNDEKDRIRSGGWLPKYPPRGKLNLQ